MNNKIAVPEQYESLIKRKTAEPKFLNLGEGDHRVRITTVKFTDSFTQFSGEPKEQEHGYADATPQWVIKMQSTEGKGSMFHRLNKLGYVRFEDLSEKDQQSGEYTNVEGYACTENKSGKLVRMVDEQRTQGANNIIDGLGHALGLTGLEEHEALEKAWDEGIEFGIRVVNEPYDGKDQMKVKNFFPVSSDASVEEEAEAEFDA